MRYFFIIWALVVILTVSILGFRGGKSRQMPITVFPDMDRQAKYLPQGGNTFFADGRNDRPPVPGAVQRGNDEHHKAVFSEDYVFPKSENPPLFTGKDDSGDWYRGFPLEINQQLLGDGAAKYAIFCQPCHGKIGDGNGITKQYGMAATASLLDDRIRTMSEGEIFNTITHGKNLMGAYGAQLRPEERWAVIAYVRALQLASAASVEDVPAQYRKELGL